VLARAEFIAGVQILVYVGGVMVLFLFVIMLVNVGAEERGAEEIFNNQRQVAASLIFCLLLVGGLLYAVNNGYRGLQAQRQYTPEVAAAQEVIRDQSLPTSETRISRRSRDSEDLAGTLYRYASLPFEIASVLLLVAIIGSVMLARTLRQEASADDIDPEVLKEELVRDPELANLEPQSE
jgi:NADH-quinone oxidoreductase subunit J